MRERVWGVMWGCGGDSAVQPQSRAGFEGGTGGTTYPLKSAQNKAPWTGQLIEIGKVGTENTPSMWSVLGQTVSGTDQSGPDGRGTNCDRPWDRLPQLRSTFAIMLRLFLGCPQGASEKNVFRTLEEFLWNIPTPQPRPTKCHHRHHFYSFFRSV